MKDIRHNSILVGLTNENEHSGLSVIIMENENKSEIINICDPTVRNNNLVETLNLTTEDGTPFQAKLQSKEENRSLLVYPHGGPHGNSIRFFSLLSHAFVENGFDVLTVNYRGSIGYGSDFVSKLPGNCGTHDVSDCLTGSLSNLVLN